VSFFSRLCVVSFSLLSNALDGVRTVECSVIKLATSSLKEQVEAEKQWQMQRVRTVSFNEVLVPVLAN